MGNNIKSPYFALFRFTMHYVHINKRWAGKKQEIYILQLQTRNQREYISNCLIFFLNKIISFHYLL